MSEQQCVQCGEEIGPGEGSCGSCGFEQPSSATGPPPPPARLNPPELDTPSEPAADDDDDDIADLLPSKNPFNGLIGMFTGKNTADTWDDGSDNDLGLPDEDLTDDAPIPDDPEPDVASDDLDVDPRDLKTLAGPKPWGKIIGGTFAVAGVIIAISILPKGSDSDDKAKAEAAAENAAAKVTLPDGYMGVWESNFRSSDPRVCPETLPPRALTQPYGCRLTIESDRIGFRNVSDRIQCAQELTFQVEEIARDSGGYVLKLKFPGEARWANASFEVTEAGLKIKQLFGFHCGIYTQQ